MEGHERVYQIIYEQDEVTWQRILYELVKSEQMDPWDVNISLLAQKYIRAIRQMQEADLRLSGKVLLASAILLKIKSNRLLHDDIMELDKLLADPMESLPDELDLTDAPVHRGAGDMPPLIPRTPQPRKRKVSIYDLMEALEKALEVKNRRILNHIPPTHTYAPRKSRDITGVIREVYGKIHAYLFKGKNEKMMFSQLVPSQQKEDKIFTFIPLLHLSNQRKIDLEQKEHFGEIEVMLASKKELKEEAATSG